MWWLAILPMIYFFRARVAKVVAPLLPDLPPQTVVFYGHLTTLVAAVLFVLPLELVFSPYRMLKRVAYLGSLWSAVGIMVFTIKSNYGPPPIPQNLGWRNLKESLSVALQPWLMKAMMGADFQFLFFALIFLPAYASVWPIAILARRSLWSVCTQCAKTNSQNRLWLLFAPTWAKLKAREPQVLAQSAVAEVLLGLWLTISLMLPTRQIFTCMLYWNYLRTRYQVPRSHEQHLQAWRQLGGQIQPLLKVVPLLQKPIDLAKGWFQPDYRSQ